MNRFHRIALSIAGWVALGVAVASPDSDASLDPPPTGTPLIINAVPFLYGTASRPWFPDPRYLDGRGFVGRFWNWSLWAVKTGEVALKLWFTPDQPHPDEVAVSPDGSLVALYFRSGRAQIWLVRMADQRVLWKRFGFSELAWSLDGRFLAATTCPGEPEFPAKLQCLIRVRDGEAVTNATRLDVELRRASWGRGGRLAAQCGGRLCVLEASDGGLKLVRPPTGSGIEWVKMSPNGEWIAISKSRSRSIEVVPADGHWPGVEVDMTGLQLEPWPVRSFNQHPSHTLLGVEQFEWSPDSRLLHALIQPRGRATIRTWELNGKIVGPDWIPAPFRAIERLAPTGSWMVTPTSGRLRWELVTAEGRIRPVVAQVEIQFRRDLRISRDGRELVFAVEDEERRQAEFAFSVLAGPLAKPTQEVEPPITEHEKLRFEKYALLADRAQLSGRSLPFGSHASRAFTPDRKTLIVSNGATLIRYDMDGESLWTVKVPWLRSLAVSGDARWILTTAGDGILRWYRMEDGREVLAAFIHSNGREWLAWTPEGYFTGSPGTERLLGWLVDHGEETLAEFVPVGRFGRRFHRPDLVEMALGDSNLAPDPRR